jgi:cyclopropane fatty-acyl-phospholipid synthase-like methyltransferase
MAIGQDLFEVVGYVEYFQPCYDLLRPRGRMSITTPVPETDWIRQVTEVLELSRKRTSPHSNLVRLLTVPLFEQKQIEIIIGLGQWAIFHRAPR